MKNIKQFFTYVVVGALVIALSVVSCSNDDKTGGAEEVNIGQYAGVYASDTASYGPSSNQYFVLRVNSDNIECGVSDSQTMPTIIRGTFTSFTKRSGEEQIAAYKSGQNISSAELTFSGSGLTFYSTTRFWYDETQRTDAIFTLQQLGESFHMTKVN